MGDFLLDKAVMLFYVNASARIGAGHVMRQLALARHMHTKGIGKIIFISKECPDAIQRELKQHNIVFEHLLDIDIATACDAFNANILCIDDYSVTAAEWDRIKNLNCLKIVFDDQQATTPFYADIVVNSAPDTQAEHYQHRVNAKFFALGLRYTVLRPEFLTVKSLPLAKRTQLLLTLGGADPTALTLPMTKALIKRFSGSAVQINVIVGGLNQAIAPQLQDMIREHPELSFIVNTPNMAEHIANAGLAISAAGSTLGELACLGTPTIALVCFDNQLAALTSSLNGSWYQAYDLRQYNALEFAKFDKDLTKIADTAFELWHNFNKRALMSEQAQAVIDGLGCQRLAELIESVI